MTISEEGLRVRARRERLGLSRRALAEQSGVFVDSIYHMESGKTQRPHRHTVAALEQALDDVEASRGLTPPPPPPPTPPAPPPCVRITIDGVTFEVPVSEWSTVDRVIDRVMANLRKHQQKEN